MAENKSTSLPHFRSVQELVEFFDTHDMGEYWDHLPEAEFEVDIQRKFHLVSIDQDLMHQLSAIAKSQHTSVAVLIDSWLREKAAGASH